MALQYHKKGIAAVAGVFASIAVIVGIVLLAISFQVLEPSEVGLLYDETTQTISIDEPTEQPFFGGRHFVGVGKYFVVYPNTVQTLDFTIESGTEITARTFDGLRVTLSLSAEYRLITEAGSLLSLYYRHEENYHDVFTKITRDVARNVAAHYTALQFFTERASVSTKLLEVLQPAFEPLGADVVTANLFEIVLPTAYVEAIALTESVRIQIGQEKEIQNMKMVTLATNLLSARQEAEAIMATSRGRANAITLERQSRAQVIRDRTNSQIEGYLNVMTELNLSSDELLDYMFTRIMSETDARLTLGISKPAGIRF